MPKKSNAVSPGEEATALQHNDLRDDALNLFAESGSELTISSGVVTIASTYDTFYDIDTQADAATDDLDTINGGEDGEIIIIRAENAARTVVVKHGADNIQLKGAQDLPLLDQTQLLMLRYDGSNWVEISAGSGRLVVFGYSLGNGQEAIVDTTYGDIPYLPTVYLLGLYATADQSGSITISVRNKGSFGIPAGGDEIESFVMTTVQSKSDTTLSGVTREQTAGSWQFYVDGLATSIQQLAIVGLGVRT